MNHVTGTQISNTYGLNVSGISGFWEKSLTEARTINNIGLEITNQSAFYSKDFKKSKHAKNTESYA